MRAVVSNVLDKSSKGWVVASIDDNPSYLCYGTTVELIACKTNFEVIRVLDGPYIGKTANIPYRSIGFKKKNSYLEEVDELVQGKVKELIFHIGTRMLSLPGIVDLNVVYTGDILKQGKYNLLIPKSPHTRLCKKYYLDEANRGTRFAETWFQIALENGQGLGNFIHFGKISSGCITVDDDGGKWTTLYSALMGNRFDNVFLAKLKVY